MISCIAKVLSIVIISVQNIILFTSIIGEIILTVIKWIYATSLHLSNNVLLFFQIVYEDNINIFTELPNSFNILSETVINQVFTLWSLLDTVYCGICVKLSVITNNLSWAANVTVLSILQILNFVRQTVIYFGNSIWFMITFVPVQMPQLIQVLARYIIDIIVVKVVKGYMVLLQFTNFLTEVPLESFLGISIFIIVVRLCIYFRTTIVTQILIFYWSFLRTVMYYFHMFYNYFTNPEVIVITRMANGEDLQTSDNFESTLDSDAENITDSLCVICQERQKCVLTLPCRHVCLCTECCRRLYGYQRTCPICRTFIYHSLTVYL